MCKNKHNQTSSKHKKQILCKNLKKKKIKNSDVPWNIFHFILYDINKIFEIWKFYVKIYG